jgi:hypothetical protein
MLAALLIAISSPSPEALRLGRELAESGTLATVLPVIQKKETDELVAAHIELSKADKARLRTVAGEVYRQGYDRLMQAEARAYAEKLSIGDLRAIAAFQKSRAGRRYKAAIPGVVMQTMKAVGGMDFKADVTAAFCRQTGKLCAR